MDKKLSSRLRKPSRRTLALLCAGLVAIIVVVVLIIVLHKDIPVEDCPTVEVEKVQTGNVNIYGEYVGRIRAQQFVEVHARVEGFLERMLFAEGSYIRKGQTLFVIDPTRYKALVEKAKASLEKAEAALEKARRDLERTRPLYEQNAMSKLELDNAEAAFETAQAEVSVRRAELTEAELTLSYTSVVSPISGYISERNADIGALVGPGSKSLLATVVNSDTVRVDFSMTALDYLNSRNRDVNIGNNGGTSASQQDGWVQYVTVTLADGSVYPYKGIVDFADPTVDPKTGTFQVRAEMPNPDKALLPGEFTRVKLLMDVRRNAIFVPTKALEIEKGGAYVYVVRRDNVVERRFVETGPEFDNSTVIERGLAAGESIIVEGYNKVKNGMKVKPILVENTSPPASDFIEIVTADDINKNDTVPPTKKK